MSDSTPTCVRCGTRLKPGAPAGPCLRCLLSFGLKEESVPEEADPPIFQSVQTIDGVSDDFGRFRLLEKLGEGGCGIVYRAEQLEPVRREVALKVIKPGMDTAMVIARFEAERQALAMMDHPGVAKVFDAGRSGGGRPFFAMELVRGDRITEYCDRRQLSVVQRLELFVRVCEAVQHAHQKGIIHRDLKPSNVLVAEHDGVAQPKVIDFGIAKATSRQRLAGQTIYTAFDQLIGTPAYMSPEQAGATGTHVDTRSDIYSLGVLLYELLTGSPPFEPTRLRQAAVDEVFRIIRDEDPARPSARLTTLNAQELSEVSRRRLAAPPKLLREVRGDLDWIVMKALEKSPQRRYETAAAFAVELRRHLNDEPVLVRPPSAAYRFRKMVRRNKLTFAASAAVLLALIVGLAVSTWRIFKEQEARRAAVAAETKARKEANRAAQVSTILKDMLSSAGPSVALGRDTTLLREILDRTAGRLGTELRGMPEIEAELRMTIGGAYYDLKLLDPAEAMHRATLNLKEASVGPASPAVADTLIDLATVLNTRATSSDLPEAEGLIRRALKIRRAAHGETNLPVADTIHLLGWNLDAQRRIRDAESAYRAALVIRRSLLQPGDLALVPSLHAVTLILLNDTQRLDEAESLIREALEIQARHLPAEHPARNDGLGILAKVLEARGKSAEAEVVMHQVIATHRRVFGNKHELLSGLLNHLAVVLNHQNKFVEAEAAMREAIAIQTLARGPNHPHLMNYHGYLFEVIFNRGAWNDAEGVARDWLRLARANGRTHDELSALEGLAKTQVAQGHWVEAEPTARESLAVCARVHENPRPAGSTRCSGIRRMLGETLLRAGNYAEAESLLLASHAELSVQTDKWARIDCEKSMAQLVSLYEATAQMEKAALWKQRLAVIQGKQGKGGGALPQQ